MLSNSYPLKTKFPILVPDASHNIISTQHSGIQQPSRKGDIPHTLSLVMGSRAWVLLHCPGMNVHLGQHKAIQQVYHKGAVPYTLRGVCGSHDTRRRKKVPWRTGMLGRVSYWSEGLDRQTDGWQ